ncbi:Fungal transcriptional regulatory protein, N-terminal [Penicillium camemberti]|uniref:Fungal transcriptional regulatory protein, N-terminal n=1 Tax=Penicillium camemberti (strain FM 013) TaxID=1429867 RepID=A0A0G4PVR4_PENC3|nr:Fungal transcriptional regulatory protein, N-terminal [Penicillium camemberti]
MEHEGSDHEGREVPSALVRRACDQCRLRKIRCDKRTPCSNCRSSSIACRSTGEGQKPSEPRRRVLISNQYEKKIDLIEERLASIESTLQQLAKNTSQPHSFTAPNRSESHFAPSPQKSTPSQPSSTTPNSAKPKGPLYLSNRTIEEHDSSAGFEGSSSLTAHGAYASAFLESAVSQSSPQVLSSPKITAALSSLKQLVGIQNQRREADLQRSQPLTKNARLGVRRDIRDLEMPPLPVALDMLRNIQENPPAFFGGYVPFLSVKYFTEKCREVYFCIQDYSDAAFIITTFCMYGLFHEYGGMEKDVTMREEHHRYIEMCRNNLETALANLNILMPANHDSIMALSLGAMHALEISKPSVAWTLASTAMNLCQTLGYHRLTSMEHDPVPVQRQKQLLFWTVYTILNMMSLRLGRASSIQNYDISLPMLEENPEEIPQPWGPVCSWWTRSAIIQSEVYQYLYSPEALQKPESERVTHAHRLAAEMQSKVMEPFEKFMSSDLKVSDMDLMYLATDKISRLAIMTLIYRAIPASADSGHGATFIPKCIETAREALEIHRNCVAALNETDNFMKISYMHWGILLSPFVPFIVLFCNIITTSNGDDLALLEEFIASLQPLTTFSQSIERLHTLCSVLGTVARLYFEANTRTQAAADQENLIEVGQEFDVYLSALGLAPPTHMNPLNSDNSQMVNSQGYSHTDNPAMHVSSAELSQPDVGGFSAPVDSSQAPGQDLGTAAQLGNWFWGNQYMMGLLEEDLSQFNPGRP